MQDKLIPLCKLYENISKTTANLQQVTDKINQGEGTLGAQLQQGGKQVRIVGGTNQNALLSAANGAKGPGTRVTTLFPRAAKAAR